MPSKVITDFDPIEWREFLPDIYCRRDDPTVIAFKCKDSFKEEKREGPVMTMPKEESKEDKN